MAKRPREPRRGPPRRYDRQLALLLTGLHPDLTVRQRGDQAVVSVKRTDVAEYGADGLRLLPSTSRSPERLSLDDALDRGALRTRIAQRVHRLFPPPATALRGTPTAADRAPAHERWAAERRRRAEERAAAEREDARPVSEVVDAALRRH